MDFLAVENETRDGQKSGDAIACRFTAPDGTVKVVVVDAGFTDVGAELADHIRTYYNVTHIDVVISTHPDTDHLNGLLTILEQFTVGELMIHQPWRYNSSASLLGNYERIVETVNAAEAAGVTVTEPFTGVHRFDGALRILGPTVEYYIQTLDEAIADAANRGATAALSHASAPTALRAALENTVGQYPNETLDNIDDTGPRNKGSVITLINSDGHRMLLTGDAGIGGLDAAADEYEHCIGPLSTYPLDFLQAPHHGSRHNLGPNILNRLLGEPGAGFGTPTAFISSAKASEKHPSPKVTNALGRRGARVYATEGRNICHYSAQRAGWSSLTPVPALAEPNED